MLKLPLVDAQLVGQQQGLTALSASDILAK
jgi:hypothetical protein